MLYIMAGLYVHRSDLAMQRSPGTLITTDFAWDPTQFCTHTVTLFSCRKSPSDIDITHLH